MRPDPASPVDLAGPAPRPRRLRLASRRASRRPAGIAVALAVVLAGAWPAGAAHRPPPPATPVRSPGPRTGRPRRPTTPDRGRKRGGRGRATVAFRARHRCRLGRVRVRRRPAPGRRSTSGAVPEARTDELAAQADYDRFRQLEGDNQTTAATLDELATDVGADQSFGGLHAVERDLWSSGDAAADITGLVAQAPVAEYLLAKDVLAPEAIGTTGVDELSWVDDMAIPGREELYSRRDAVDIAATVGAADDAFVAIEPLGHLVAPSLTTSVDQQFTQLLGRSTSLGDPTQLPDQDISATGPPVPVPTGGCHRGRAVAAGRRAGSLRDDRTLVMTERMSRRRLLAGTGVASAALVAAAGVGPAGCRSLRQHPAPRRSGGQIPVRRHPPGRHHHARTEPDGLRHLRRHRR